MKFVLFAPTIPWSLTMYSFNIPSWSDIDQVNFDKKKYIKKNDKKGNTYYTQIVSAPK